MIGSQFSGKKWSVIPDKIWPGTPDANISVRQWCQENKINVSNYYKWQRRIYALAKAEQESRFAEVSPLITDPGTASVAITVHVAGVAADIHNGADPSTVEAVLRILKLC